MKKIKLLPYRRKREGNTNYKKRLELLKSGKIRVVVRRTLRNILVQAVQYEKDGDKTLFSTTSKDLKKYGWKGYGRNTPAAYLVGYLFGTKAKQHKVAEAILDQGLYATRQGTITFAVLKGVVDAGLQVPHDPKIFPNEERIKGKHISEDVSKEFEAVKANIQKVK